MKIKGTDFGIKYFMAKVDGVDVTVEFRTSFLRGIYAANIWVHDKKTHDVEILGKYPGFFGVLAEVLIRLPFGLGRHCTGLHDRLYNLNNRIAESGGHDMY